MKVYVGRWGLLPEEWEAISYEEYYEVIKN